jgi:hypothetical protein
VGAGGKWGSQTVLIDHREEMRREERVHGCKINRIIIYIYILGKTTKKKRKKKKERKRKALKNERTSHPEKPSRELEAHRMFSLLLSSTKRIDLLL